MISAGYVTQLVSGDFGALLQALQAPGAVGADAPSCITFQTHYLGYLQLLSRQDRRDFSLV